MAAKKNKYINVDYNDAPEIQCIVCKEEDCEYYIELDFANISFIGIHKNCFRGYSPSSKKKK
jgi:hypothetical protein